MVVNNAKVSKKSTSIEALFRPFDLKGLHLANRVVMAPMTRFFSPDGVPGQDVADYYARRARADIGLIITEGTYVDEGSSGFSPSVPRFFGETALSGWKSVVETVHEAGGRIMPQLWHVGPQEVPDDVNDPDRPPLSPSGLLGPGNPVGKAMTIGQIESVINAFGAAAENAFRLGFDGIELHGGHGYLLDAFFWHGTNLRTDKYGGSLVERTRFVGDIVRECRRRTSAIFPISLRFSQWKNVDYGAKLATTPAELESFLEPLADAGVDIFDCSTRRFWEPEFPDSDLNLAGWTKKLSGKPTITVGSVGLDQDLFTSLNSDDTKYSGNVEQLMNMFERGDFDLVAIGRALLADPLWVTKIRRGRVDELSIFKKDALVTLC